MKLTKESKTKTSEPQAWVNARLVFNVSLPVEDIADYLGYYDSNDKIEFTGNSDEDLVEYLALAGAGLTGSDETLPRVNSLLWELGCIETDWPDELEITLEVK